MKVNAIIAEYNPLHKGHEYLINKGKKLTEADYTIVVMSGSYVQRGEPAVMDKELRTLAALKAGADLVIELPIYYSTASAEYFAKGAVKLLSDLNICDYLIFGSETDDIELLTDIAIMSVEYEKEMYEYISDYMAEGNSYPKAFSLAIDDIILSESEYDMSEYRALLSYTRDEIAEILASPNSTLAVCYIKSILALNSRLTPVALKRIVSDYNDLSLGAYSSSAIRKELNEENYAPLKDQLSEDIYRLTADSISISCPVNPDDYSDILLYKLRSIIFGNGNRLKSKAVLELTSYLDVSEALAGRIINSINDYRSFSQFVALIKTKSVTYSHISRALMHIVLDIKKSNASRYINNDYAMYARILGFRKDSSLLLHELKDFSQIPVISKLADAENVIGNEFTLKLLNETVSADELHTYMSASKFGREFTPELSKQIVII